MNKKVEGIYASIDEAMHAIDRLSDAGYSRSNIYVVANEEVRKAIPFTMDAEVTSEESIRGDGHADNQSLWDKIKDAFTFDDTSYDDPGNEAGLDPLAQHRQDIERGNIVVLLDEDTRTTDDTTILEGTMGNITSPADPAISEGVTGPTDPAFVRDTDPVLEDDVKATDPPLMADMEPNNQLVSQPSVELTTKDMRTEPPLTGETVNDVNVPLNEELDLADQEREKETPQSDTIAGDDSPAEPGMPSNPDTRS